MWKKILGHKKQVEQLQKDLEENKVPHAYLFSGIEGIGKRGVALGLAQALLSWQKTEKNFHPDFHLIEPAGQTIKVEVLRQLKQKIYLHPLEGIAKVVLIDKAEAMTDAGANALLKILEEPPQQTYFILISSQPTKLLPTIRSRCQRLEFNPLSEQEIRELLVKQGMDLKEASQRAAFAQGSLQAALSFDAALFEQIQNGIEGLRVDPKPSQILALSETWSEEGEKIPFILTSLTHLWHKKIMETRDEKTSRQLSLQWFAIGQASRSLETYANKQLLLENLLFTLTA
jgi:DNA polymerase-3 subunit delta'